jgi:hypothetical protein
MFGRARTDTIPLAMRPMIALRSMVTGMHDTKSEWIDGIEDRG